MTIQEEHAKGMQVKGMEVGRVPNQLAYGFDEDDLVLDQLSVEAYNAKSLTFQEMMQWPDGFSHLTRNGVGGGRDTRGEEAMARVMTHSLALLAKLRNNWDSGMKRPDYRMIYEGQEPDWAYLWLACLDTALIWECG